MSAYRTFDVGNGRTNFMAIVIQQSSPLKAVQASDRVAELVQYISALESGSADARTLQKLALLCVENPIKDPLSPSGSNGEFSDPVSPTPFSGNVRSVPSLHKDLWTEDKHFDRLFDGLMRLLTPTRVRPSSRPACTRG